MRAVMIVLLVGCAEEEATESVTIDSGTYDLTFGEITGDCEFDNIFVNTDPASTAFTATDGGFEIAFGAFGSMPCTISGSDYTCEWIDGFETDLGQFGKSAVVGNQLGSSGAWADSATVSGSITTRFSCDGDDCADLSDTSYGAAAAFPCDMIVSMDGVLAP